MLQCIVHFTNVNMVEKEMGRKKYVEKIVLCWKKNRIRVHIKKGKSIYLDSQCVKDKSNL